MHQMLKNSPYHLTYGQHPRVGISNLPIAPEVLAQIATEAQLNDACARMSGSIFVDRSQNDAAAAAVVDGTDFGRTMATIAAAVQEEGDIQQ